MEKKEKLIKKTSKIPKTTDVALKEQTTPKPHTPIELPPFLLPTHHSITKTPVKYPVFALVTADTCSMLPTKHHASHPDSDTLSPHPHS